MKPTCYCIVCGEEIPRVEWRGHIKKEKDTWGYNIYDRIKNQRKSKAKRERWHKRTGGQLLMTDYG